MSVFKFSKFLNILKFSKKIEKFANLKSLQIRRAGGSRIFQNLENLEMLKILTVLKNERFQIFKILEYLEIFEKKMKNLQI